MNIKTIPLALVALTLGGCVSTFDTIPFSEQEESFKQALTEEIKSSNDEDARLQLGRMMFEHNYLDEADEELGKLVEENPENYEALAWFGANNCKQAGAAIPWAMGIRKMVMVNECIGQIDTALKAEPDNFTIRLIAINTGSVVKVMGSLDTAVQEKEKLDAEIEKQPDLYTPDAKSHFYLAAAQTETALENKEGAQAYLNKVLELNANETVTSMAKAKIAGL